MRCNRVIGVKSFLRLLGSLPAPVRQKYSGPKTSCPVSSIATPAYPALRGRSPYLCPCLGWYRTTVLAIYQSMLGWTGLESTSQNIIHVKKQRTSSEPKATRRNPRERKKKKWSRQKVRICPFLASFSWVWVGFWGLRSSLVEHKMIFMFSNPTQLS